MTRTMRMRRPMTRAAFPAVGAASLLVSAWAMAETPAPKASLPAPAAAKSAKGKAGAAGAKEQRVELTVTPDGFVPDTVKVKVGVPVRLVVTRKVERTCADSIVIKDFGVDAPLPVGKAVEVTLTPKKPGEIRYACSMDMIAGKLVAE